MPARKNFRAGYMKEQTKNMPTAVRSEGEQAVCKARRLFCSLLRYAAMRKNVR